MRTMVSSDGGSSGGVLVGGRVRLGGEEHGDGDVGQATVGARGCLERHAHDLDLLGDGARGGDDVLVEQAVGGTCLVPTVAGTGNAQRRFLSQGLQQLPGAAIEAAIAEVDRGQLRGQGAHALTPSAARKFAASG